MLLNMLKYIKSLTDSIVAFMHQRISICLFTIFVRAAARMITKATEEHFTSIHDDCATAAHIMQHCLATYNVYTLV